MTAQQTGAHRKAKRGATCQQTELHSAVANPALGPSSTSATSALDRPRHNRPHPRVKMRRRDQATFRPFLRSV
jgi:hypothetical protein